MATDEQVNKRQAEIAALQREAEEARIASLTADREADNDVFMAQLNAEEVRLRAQIEQSRAAGDAKTQRAAIAAQVAAVSDDPSVKYPKGVEVQKLSDGTYQVLSVKSDETPEVPPPVTTDTVPEPTTDSVPEPKPVPRPKAAKE